MPNRIQVFKLNKKTLLLFLITSILLVIGLVGLVMLEQFGLTKLITIVGYPGIWSIVFAESGLFFGFFLPGDSLLVTTGLLASQNFFNILILTLILPIGAILGDTIGYWFGNKMGPKIFSEADKKSLLSKKHLNSANLFYKKHGKKTIIIARFIPIIRTFAPIVAGAAQMNYSQFIAYNMIGGILWTLSMLYIGYFLGTTIPNIDKYLIPIIILIVILSLLPPILEFIKNKRK